MQQEGWTRRKFLGTAGAAASAAALGWGFSAEVSAQAGTPLFALGVASGDPDANSVTLWTRLTRDPLNGGGMGTAPVAVVYEVAEDVNFRRLVRRGAVLAKADRGHTVNLRVGGLRADRWYFYRFSAQGEQSRVGRTRTFPRPHDMPRKLRFAMASCQDYQNGFFSAYHDMAREDLDFVVHTGDYIYEYGPREGAPRQVVGAEITTITDYRNRYAQYRLDPQLQAAHAAFPFIVTWDDHEVDNNYAALIPEDAQTPDAFAQRRAAAYQAYFEHMPVAVAKRKGGSATQLHRRLSFGRLADFNVLDTRQFRTDQPCGDGFTFCEDVYDANASLLGKEQMRWLQANLRASPATWNVLAQQVMITRWDARALAGTPDTPFFNVDAWDGYQAARTELLGFIADHCVQNPVVLTGDIHSSWVADLKRDFADPTSAVIGTEFVGTSITSDFPAALVPAIERTLADNPHIQFFDGLHRGYVVCEVTKDLWRANFRAVSSILEPEASAFTLASYVVEAGRAGAQVG